LKAGLPVVSGLAYYAHLFTQPLNSLFPRTYDYAHYGLPFILVVLPAAVWAYARRWPGTPAMQREWATAAIFLALAFGAVLLRLPDPWDQRFMVWLVPVALVVALPVLARWVSPAFLCVLTVGLALLVGHHVLRQLPPLRAGAGALVRRHTFRDVTDLLQPRVYKTSGYAALHGAPRGSTVLYIGGDGTIEYPCWGWRLDRVVWTADTPARVDTQLARRPDYVVIEQMAPPAARDAALHQVAAQGYAPVADTLRSADVYDARAVWRAPHAAVAAP
jgi:hypothetical protein